MTQRVRVEPRQPAVTPGSLAVPPPAVAPIA